MELNFKLPKKYREFLAEQTSESPIYCVFSDIDLEGNYTDDICVGATQEMLFVFGKDRKEFYKLNECEDVKNINMVNGGALVLKRNGEEKLLVRYSMNRLSRFAYVARGIHLLIEGNTERRIVSHDRERVCKKCGRVLPGTKMCPRCDGKSLNLKRMISLCNPYKVILFIVFFSMVSNSAVDVIKQFIFRDFIDEHLSTQSGVIGDVLAFFAFLLTVTLAQVGLYILRANICNKLGARISYDLRKKMVTKIQGLSLSFIGKRHTGALLNRITGDTERVKRFMQDTFCNFFAQLINLAALIVIMLIMNWKLALAAFAFAPIIVIFSKTFWPHIRRIYHNQWKKYDKINSKLQDVLSGIRVVKVFGKEKDETEKFKELNKEHANVQTSNETFFAAVHPFFSLFLSFGSYLIVYLGGADVLRGSMTPGELSQFLTYSGMLLGPLSWMTFLPRQLVLTTTSLERIYDVLDEESEIADTEDSVKLKVKGEVEFKNVVFGYHSYEPVLEGINLKVKPGEMIGLVGSSGCGKSTLTNLVMRLYDTDEGEITVDGVNIKDLNIMDFHSQIGVVLQETFLFAGTILDNIRFAKPDADMSEIIIAAKRANAHEFIIKMPDGYNTYIGENGHALSGGEKQRIAIARAILNEPRLLILDEATSSLDTESEYQIQEALERLRKGRTTFAIAHRLSTLRAADRIAVINNHKIAEIGTHNELLRKKGIYYDLVMAQLQMSKTAVD